VGSPPVVVFNIVDATLNPLHLLMASDARAVVPCGGARPPVYVGATVAPRREPSTDGCGNVEQTSKDDEQHLECDVTASRMHGDLRNKYY
jgi:hypothetical protein